jgi:hypothetical protein
MWHTKSQEYEAHCEKLQHYLEEKELMFADVKELLLKGIKFTDVILIDCKCNNHIVNTDKSPLRFS